MVYDKATDRALGLTPATSYNQMSGGYNTISCPRAMLLHEVSPPLGVASGVHATNKPRKQHLQCQPMPSSRHRGPDFLGAPRAVESLAQASVLPIPTLIRRAETGSSDSIKALVKADVRPPVREVTPAHMDMIAVTDTPAACHLRYTNHSQVHP